MKKYISFLIICLIIVTSFSEKTVKSSDEIIKKECKRFSQDFKFYKHKGIRFSHYFEKEKEYFIFLTSDFSRIKGYSGNTDLILAVDRDMVIGKIELVSSEDTADYINFMTAFGFFSGFTGKTVNKETGKFDNVDVISGATMTSQSVMGNIAETIEEAGKIIKNTTYDIKEKKLIFN